ncbi:hypothetical protein RI129_008608 [Pyrocoelia pectoralis]|uniref:MADF domain-containing protein n=1 Tax=Pyrocoelia pectoralis TaxID=417401 RepID=A0AAN7ZL16_9COLE
MTTEGKKGNREILEDFIKIYRSEPCLWNIKAKDYHNKVKKENAYRRLIEKLKEIDAAAANNAPSSSVDDIFIQYVRHRIELYTVADQLHLCRVAAKLPFKYTCTINLCMNTSANKQPPENEF